MRLYSTKGERNLMIFCIVLMLTWVAGVAAPWFLLSPETFWEKFFMLAGTIVWASILGTVEFAILLVYTEVFKP